MAAVQSQSAPSAPVTDLRKSIDAHDETFTKLLSLIPAQYYIVDTPEEADTKWMRNKKKRSADELTETRKKAKFDKFDPSNNKTIPEIQAERAAKAHEADDHEEGVNPGGKPIVPMAPASSVTDLRKKLQDKIDSFRKRRREAPLHPPAGDAAAEGSAAGKDGNGTDDDGMTAASRDEMLEERRRRRGEVRDNRRNRRKEERRAEREGKSGKKEVKGDKAGEKKSTDFTAKTGKTALIVDPLPKGAPGKAAAPAMPEDNVSFASIALPSTSGSKTSSHLKNISNPTQALQHLQNQKAKLAELPAEKRKQIEEKEKWAKAQERAEGGKVRDDETRLKKAAKRVDKQKAKSSKEWSDRKEELRNSAAVKAKKRNENINSRNEAKKNKKLGLKPKGDKGSSKKGGPGFSGGKKRKT
ncbi:hypothetical protein NCC49_001621 [Naganishia albida]|nr:hypothetical protein NCC49_001621 [Naganishia albida]